MTHGLNEFSLNAPGGVGLGLRQELVAELQAAATGTIDFVELAPENWLDMGGKFRKQLAAIAARYPLACHGLSLSLGGPAPLDVEFLRSLRSFLDGYGVAIYSEHLSYCGDDGHLYDLLPIPFTEEAVHYVAQRIRTAQDILQRRIAVENVSYYAAPGRELDEPTFINAVLTEADCDLLLDVNNVYVNSVNHGYDAVAFLDALPAARVRYLHVAGHYRQAPDLIVDSHGADVIDPVWDLLARAYRHVGPLPTVLERDFNVPPLPELLRETQRIRAAQAAAIAVDRDARRAVMSSRL